MNIYKINIESSDMPNTEVKYVLGLSVEDALDALESKLNKESYFGVTELVGSVYAVSPNI